MVSEVDQKYLGIFAKQTALNDPELSAALYKVLGLSTLLNRKLVRAVRITFPHLLLQNPNSPPHSHQSTRLTPPPTAEAAQVRSHTSYQIT